LLLAHRWPERGSIGSQLRHEGVSAVEGVVEGTGGDGEAGGGGAPRHVSSTLTVHRDTQALLETRSPEEGGVTATERPGNTEPVGKSGMQPQGETDLGKH
jgi:hypothetical protein